jgi:ATP-binding cassette subfamily B (MDR/TAP) protein 1
MGAAFKAQGFAVEAQESAASATAIATEAVAGYRTIATFQMQEHVAAMFDEEMTASTSSSIKNVITTAALYGVLGLGMQFGTNAIAFAYGGHLVAQGIYTADDIMKCFLLVQGIGTGLAMAMAFAPDKIKSEAAKGACFGLILQQPTIASKENAEKPSLADPKQDIVFDKVDFSYPTRPDNFVFKQMSLTFEAGKQTALVGATGCGKSSAVSLLQRFYDPAAGRILIGGVDIKDVSVHSLRSCIGIVSQEPVLFAASIKDNILLGKPDATDTEVKDACVRANAHDFISKMATGYDTLVGPKGSQVSGEFCTGSFRTCMARAINRSGNRGSESRIKSIGGKPENLEPSLARRTEAAHCHCAGDHSITIDSFAGRGDIR